MEPAGPGRVERRLAAILAADVAGYSRLMAADESGTLARLKRLRAEVIEPKIAEFHGQIVGSAGDSLLVEFASAIDAVACAAAIQQGMAVRNTSVPDDRKILFRIGINLGDVIVVGDDIHGDGVNIAARLQELAEPGGVSISGTIFEQVDGKVDQTFVDLGNQQIKNIDKLVSRGVVQRAADPDDNRRVLVYISDLGLETVARLKRRVDAHHESIEEALGPRKTSQLKKLLETLIAESRPN